MHNPGIVGPHVLRASREPGVEIAEPQTPGALPQDESNGLVELLCEWTVMKKSTIENPNYNTENVSEKLLCQMQTISTV